MNKETLNQALYRAVEITHIDGEVSVGWLIPSPHFKNEYMVLPLDLTQLEYSFFANGVESVKYLSNGVILK